MWFVLRSQSSVQRIQQMLDQAMVEHFYPTYTVTEHGAHGTIRKEKPLALNLIFINATEQRVEKICEEHEKLSPVYHYEKGKARSLLVVPDRQMDMFIQAVGRYNGEPQYLDPKAMDLTQGDFVRIIGGPFAGIEGTLLTDQGRDGGRVLVQVSNLVAIPTIAIAPQDLQVLRFATHGNHAYKKFESFRKRLDAALLNLKTKGTISLADEQAMVSYLLRYDNLTLHSQNLRVKHLVFQFMAHKVLSHPVEQQNAVRAKIEALVPVLTSRTAIDFVNSYLC